MFGMDPRKLAAEKMGKLAGLPSFDGLMPQLAKAGEIAAHLVQTVERIERHLAAIDRNIAQAHGGEACAVCRAPASIRELTRMEAAGE